MWTGVEVTLSLPTARKRYTVREKKYSVGYDCWESRKMG